MSAAHPPEVPDRRKERLTAYDPAFLQHMIDFEIYPFDIYAPEPTNLAAITKRLKRRRPSLSASQVTNQDFQIFRAKNARVLSEADCMMTDFPWIIGRSPNYYGANILFGNLSDLTNGDIVHAKPDFFEGCAPGELDKQVQQDLGKDIVPSSNPRAPCLPSFFAELKGPVGDRYVGQNQVLYDGALGARGIHQLRMYIDPETAYDNKAYAITATYESLGGQIVLYATHTIPPKDSANRIQYVQTLLGGWCIKYDIQSFRRGITAFRNAQDWAKEQRDELVATANSIVQDV